MIIYEFSTLNLRNNGFNGFFGVREIEVVEKTKTYVGKDHRINKDAIGKLQDSCGSVMYLLENNSEIYINAIIECCRNSVYIAETRLSAARENLSKWSALAKSEGGGAICQDT